jgi:hypothetical protein
MARQSSPMKISLVPSGLPSTSAPAMTQAISASAYGNQDLATHGTDFTAAAVIDVAA